MRVALLIEFLDSKGKLVEKKSLKSSFNQFRRHAARLPGLTGHAYYDLVKTKSVTIKAPDGAYKYTLSEAT